jgi:hypothetical protein
VLSIIMARDQLWVPHIFMSSWSQLIWEFSKPTTLPVPSAEVIDLWSYTSITPSYVYHGA